MSEPDAATGPIVDLLGPVRIQGPDEPQILTRRMEIGVLGMLALHAGTPVTGSNLIDLLWPQDPPRTAAKTLQGYVKRVRGLLAGARVELSYVGPAGYLLALAPEQVDALRFESLVAAARTCPDDSLRVQQLDEALALWRGEPFAGCDLEGLGPFRQWLERLRSGARLERATADIRRGVTEQTISALRVLIAQEPTNERLWLHLIAALYLVGNPVAALEASAEARRELDERVGVAPGPELMEIEHRIGVHDDVEGCYVRLTGIELRPATVTPGPASGSTPGSGSGADRERANAALPMPVWAGELVDREDTVADIVRQIDRGVPVVTIVGPGGMGKTRCAVEAARQAGTVCVGFLDLSGIVSADALAVHLAGTIGTPGHDDPFVAIAEKLARHRCSVLLDNAEQIVGGADVIGRLASLCPSVTWLVTSRLELGLEAERVTRLQPLPLDPVAGGMSLSAALLLSAAERRGVSLPAAAHPVIEQIAAAIGGIPLALELAACQLQSLDPATLLRALDDPLVTLVDRRRAIDRHRSMRACFELGLDQLSPDGLVLLALLSGRPNGARYDDLAAVWPAESAEPLPAALAELVELGFATRTTDTAGATRITQLPVVRALGRELTVADQLGPLPAALDAVVMGRVAAASAGGHTSDVEPDLADVRRLLQFGVDDDAGLEPALGLAAALVIYWWSHRMVEGRGWLHALLRRPVRQQPSVNRLLALNSAVFLDYGVGDSDSARRHADEALATGAAMVPPVHSMLLSRTAMLDAAEESIDLARSRAAESLAIARAIGDGQVLWLTLGNCGDVAIATGDRQQARELYLECIDQLRRSGISWLAAAPCGRLGDLELSAGRLTESRMWFDRAVSLWLDRELGAGAGQTLAGAARLDVIEGRLADARTHLDAGLLAAEKSGSRIEYPFLTIGYAALAAARDDDDTARALFALALSHGRRAGVALRPMIDGELASLYRSKVDRCSPENDEALALTTSLEDLPAIIRRLIGP